MGQTQTSECGPRPEDLVKIKLVSEEACVKYASLILHGSGQDEHAGNLELQRLKLLNSIHSHHPNERTTKKACWLTDSTVQKHVSETIFESYRNSFKYQVKTKARIMKNKRIGQKADPLTFCTVASCNIATCNRKHVAAIDERSLCFLKAKQEAKNAGVSLWVYFAKRERASP
jgi:hypothetical protein